MTTAEELFQHDLREAACRHNRYWKASSLPTIERFKRKPNPPKSPRDRVLIKILRMNVMAAGRKLISR
ncbi:DUF7301 family protein [Serratia fonticola]|uniref:DUF7301 family protein n=1 Tax=Serratia fonticola TaxID=47917 RepID=UPI00406BC46A